MRGFGGFRAFYYLQTLLTGDNETGRKSRTISYPKTVSTHRKKMKLRNFNVFILLLFMTACVMTRQNKVFIGGWTDKDFDFFESVVHNSKGNYLNEITGLKWGGISYDMQMNLKEFKWIRQSENMIVFFNTVNRIGLEKFISKEDFNKKLFEDDYWDFDWEAKSLNNICKSLISCFNDTTGHEQYFIKFWDRRRAENNEQSVYDILCKIDNVYNQNLVDQHKISEQYDTTMFNLLSFDTELHFADSVQRKKIIIEYFDYLRAKGLNHSAYNLIFEIKEYQDISLHRDSLLQVLQPDTLTEEMYWRTRNDAKWIKSYRDNGP